MRSYTVLLATAIIVCIYIAIYRAVRRAASNSLQAKREREMKLQNLKMTKSCAIVVTCTVIRFLPFAIARSLNSSIFTVFFMEVWAKTLALLSSSLNSLVLFWRNPIRRKEAKAVLKDPKKFTRRLPVIQRTEHNM